ncbi:homoserine kinase [Neptunomonas japonica]|uniref:homoserine kinase n=1 Tax=Neptunomonas japonica TaxID=417574 RepID=UPI00040B0628|nr:homoserine kinase [Neptunomonas japonica]
MAVYTQLSQDDMTNLLVQYDLGQLVSYKGIEGGIENTNYFVTLEKDHQQTEYVLTVFEEFGMDDMPFFVELTTWLAERQLPVPFPFKDSNGIALKKLHNRPALIQPRFSGEHVAQQDLTPEHCASIGTHLAKFHLAAENFYLRRQAHRGVFWWRRESQNIQRYLSKEDGELLAQEVRLFDELREQPWGLPMGIIHGDMFHDNALFEGNQVSAILDVYNAATAFLLFDLAIVANDWCTLPDGTIDTQREQALLKAYHAQRPFTADEYKAWPQLTRTAAMRFWLSRLIPACGIEQAGRQSGDMVIKDPDELKRILLNRIATPSSLPS